MADSTANANGNSLPFRTERWSEQRAHLPREGYHIQANYDADGVTLFQAYNARIAEAAVKDQKFGGGGFKPGRMTWVKPGFLWMMYRSGWAKKDEDQRRVLAVRFSHEGFLTLLAAGVHATYMPEVYGDEGAWQRALADSGVRIQWDPDRLPRGAPMARRALQIGIGGVHARRYAAGDYTLSITDITPFVIEQARQMDDPLVPEERVYKIADPALFTRLFLDRDEWNINNDDGR